LLKNESVYTPFAMGEKCLEIKIPIKRNNNNINEDRATKEENPHQFRSDWHSDQPR